MCKLRVLRAENGGNKTIERKQLLQNSEDRIVSTNGDDNKENLLSFVTAPLANRSLVMRSGLSVIPGH